MHEIMNFPTLCHYMNLVSTASHPPFTYNLPSGLITHYLAIHKLGMRLNLDHNLDQPSNTWFGHTRKNTKPILVLLTVMQNLLKKIDVELVDSHQVFIM